MQLPDEGKMDLSQEGVEAFNAEFTKNTPRRAERRRARRNRAIAIGVAVGLATGAVGGHFLHKAILDRQDYERASELTHTYKALGACVLPERLLTGQNHDFEYATGKHLVEAATNQNNRIIRVGDIFITPNGERIAVIEEEIELTTYKLVECYEVDGQTFYSEPAGYSYDSKLGTCVKVENKVVEVYTYDNTIAHNIQFGVAPYKNSKVKEVLSWQEYDTISYEEAKEMKLIVDVDDEYVNSDGSYFNEATLRLVPNNRK